VFFGTSYYSERPSIHLFLRASFGFICSLELRFLGFLQLHYHFLSMQHFYFTTNTCHLLCCLSWREMHRTYGVDGTTIKNNISPSREQPAILNQDILFSGFWLSLVNILEPICPSGTLNRTVKGFILSFQTQVSQEWTIFLACKILQRFYSICFVSINIMLFEVRL